MRAQEFLTSPYHTPYWILAIGFRRCVICSCCSVAESCPVYCNHMDCRPASVYAIFWTKMLEWVAVSVILCSVSPQPSPSIFSTKTPLIVYYVLDTFLSTLWALFNLIFTITVFLLMRDNWGSKESLSSLIRNFDRYIMKISIFKPRSAHLSTTLYTFEMNKQCKTQWAVFFIFNCLESSGLKPVGGRTLA